MKLSGTGDISSGSVLIDNGTFNLAGLTGAGTSLQRLSGAGTVVTGGKTLSLTAASDQFGGVISGGGGLAVVSGIGKTLTGINTYSGATTNQLRHEASPVGRWGSISNSSVVDTSGEFNIKDATGPVSIKKLSPAPRAARVVLGGNTLVLTAAGAKNFGGVISGTGGLSLTGGTGTLSGVNTFTGATTVSPAGVGNAILKLSGAGDISSSSGLTVDKSAVANGTFDITGISATGTSIQSLAGSGAVALGTKVLTVTNASGIFTGVIGSGNNTTNGLVIAGGTQSLTGANTFKGATTISSGAILQATGSLSGSVTNNGTLKVLNATTGAPGGHLQSKTTRATRRVVAASLAWRSAAQAATRSWTSAAPYRSRVSWMSISSTASNSRWVRLSMTTSWSFRDFTGDFASFFFKWVQLQRQGGWPFISSRASARFQCQLHDDARGQFV